MPDRYSTTVDLTHFVVHVGVHAKHSGPLSAQDFGKHVQSWLLEGFEETEKEWLTSLDSEKVREAIEEVSKRREAADREIAALQAAAEGAS